MPTHCLRILVGSVVPEVAVKVGALLRMSTCASNLTEGLQILSPKITEYPSRMPGGMREPSDASGVVACTGRPEMDARFCTRFRRLSGRPVGVANVR